MRGRDGTYEDLMMRVLEVRERKGEKGQQAYVDPTCSTPLRCPNPVLE